MEIKLYYIKKQVHNYFQSSSIAKKGKEERLRM